MSSLAVPSALNISQSRKRSHDQITRSETRSVSPGPASKRRRVQRSSTTRNTPSITPRPPRFIGDGFDHRRPAMTNRMQNDDLIDLTADDDNEDLSPGGRFSPDAPDLPFDPALSDDDGDGDYLPFSRGVPPNPARNVQPIPVIDLSDDDDDPAPQLNRVSPLRRASTSSDIVFIAERAVTPIAPRVQPRRPSVRSRRPTPGPHVLRDPTTLAAPPPMPGLGIPDIIRRSAHTILGYAPGFLQPNPHNRAAIPGVVDLDDEYDIDLDYGRAAFALDNRESETPQATPGAAYVEPPPVPEGFAGDVEEDGVYVCPKCELEIATGSEEKQQLWVVRQCGHVYCGDCARLRNFKNGNRRDKKNLNKARGSEDAFRVCAVEGCSSKVDTKESMILVYF